ncbi:uncharacterized protein EKO05_0010867 [Ascochyta rabiei]|uniref:Uncharacterized protein n=1 Tax=Didymella rabiei TaxID=5454 RepID=A0A162ZTP3_DIDRA|nr:uncharacterized protein EKO05_0010867 [Ascochyta rabiei]KZM20799.1 hypothetical protein ST47_g8054 [Ascochyta rabiei]UPX20639.1 hypothetical protein EKO05_0010867 [Ascochyta rabiei]
MMPPLKLTSASRGCSEPNVSAGLDDWRNRTVRTSTPLTVNSGCEQENDAIQKVPESWVNMHCVMQLLMKKSNMIYQHNDHNLVAKETKDSGEKHIMVHSMEGRMVMLQ